MENSDKTNTDLSAQVTSLQTRLAQLEQEYNQLGANLQQSKLEQQNTAILLQTIIDNCSPNIYVKDPEGRYLWVNQSVKAAFPELKVGLTDYDVFDLKSSEEWGENDRRVLQAATFLENEEIVPNPNGNIHYLSRKFPLRDSEGKVYAIGAISTDVSQQRQAEQELRESESRYRDLAETLPQLVWTTQMDGKANYFNKRWYEYTGQQPEEALGSGWAEALHPDDRENALEVWQSSVRDVQLYQVEYRIRQTDGNYRWFLARGLPIKNRQGQVLQWFGTSTDIEDQKRAEQSLQLLAESGKVLSASLDYKATLPDFCRLLVPSIADWCVIDLLNEEGDFERLGVAHINPSKQPALEELAHRFWRDFQAEEQIIPRVLQTGQAEMFIDLPTERLKSIITNPDHLRLLLELDLRSFLVLPLIARERTIGIIILVMGESGRRYSQSDLSLAQELAQRAALAIDNARFYQQAQKAIQLRDEFLLIAAHELRTPVTSLKGYSQLVLNQMDKNTELNPARVQRALRAIVRQSDRLSYLITQLLDVSRLETGRMVLNLEPTDISNLAQTVLSNFQSSLTEVPTLVLETPSSVIAWVDYVRVEQVLTNLLSNAIKYTPNDKVVKIEISVPEDSETVQIAVVDQGAGIPVEYRSRLFERYSQAQPDNNKAGMGLSLYISRQIAELHKGRIEAEFPPEKGSRFVLHLPIKPPSEQNSVTQKAQ